MAKLSFLRVNVRVDTHGGLEDGRIGIVRRTIALWLIGLAQRLLRSRIDITMSR